MRECDDVLKKSEKLFQEKIKIGGFGDFRWDMGIWAKKKGFFCRRRNSNGLETKGNKGKSCKKLNQKDDAMTKIFHFSPLLNLFYLNINKTPTSYKIRKLN